MTQRTDTATLIEATKTIAVSCVWPGTELRELLVAVADRLKEQESTIRHLRTELCNASAVAMGHAEAVRTFREELDLLNSRPKR